MKRRLGAALALPGILAIVATLAVAAAPLFRPWTVAGHSTVLELVRLEALGAAVDGGDRWPRWLPDLYARYGSPLPLYYPQLPSRVPLLLETAGLRPAAALQAAFALFWIAGGVGAGWAARRWFGAGAALPAAAIFSLSPYLLFDVYDRLAFAETAALALLPWALGATTLRGGAGRAALALAAAALVLSHDVVALVAVPVLALLVLVGERTELWRRLAALACGVGMAAFFWIPALALRGAVHAEESLTRGGFDVHAHLLPLAAVLPFGAGERVPMGAGRFVPARLGELGWLFLLLAPLAIVRVRGAARRRALALAAVAFAALAMTARFSAPAWDLLPLARYVQFPFRLLTLVATAAALLAGGTVGRLPERARAGTVVALALAGLWLARPWLDVRYAFLEPAARRMAVVTRAEAPRAARDPRLVAPDRLLDLAYLRSTSMSATASDDFLPRSADRAPEAPAPAAATAWNGGVRVIESSWGYPTITARVEVAAPGIVALSQFDFPGWEVTVDGAPRGHHAEPGRGRLLVPLRPGDRQIRARFVRTPLERSSAALSLVSLLALGLVVRRAGASDAAPPAPPRTTLGTAC